MLVNGTARGEDGAQMTVSSSEIIDIYDSILDEHDRRGERSDTIICWTLTAMSKLTIRLSDITDRVKEITSSFTDHSNVEIQQRACEYLEILKAGKWEESERMSIFEPIPFKGNENMLVDNSNRAVKDEDDGDLMETQ